MNDIELETLLRKSFKENNNEFPFENEIDNLIGDMYKRRKKKKILYFIPIILTSTTVFAITYSVFNLSSVGINDSAIELATQNGYVENLDMPMQTYDNLGIKIDNFLIDDINLDISFEFMLYNFNIKNIRDINLLNLRIYDENNNILYKVNNNMVYTEDTEVENMIAKTMGYSKVQTVSDSTFKNTFFAQSTNFPKSKKIYVEFNKVLLHCKNEDKYIDGKWKFEIDVPENMINRESINYKCISNNNNEDIIIDNMKLTNTGLILETNLEKIYKDITLIINNNKYKTSNNVLAINKEDMNKIRYILNYNITNYDIPNEIKVKIKDVEMIFVRDN